ncbi:MAG: SCO family protein [Acetobacteraceae bacterium]|nr:SCO family protein [Acetobacteraceae bacterium]
MRRAGFLAALLAAALAAPLAIGAPVQRLDPRAVIARSEAAIGRVLGEHVLTTSDQKPLALSALRGRPVVISLIYTSCSTVCPVATRQLEDSIARANRLIGPGRFNVLTIGFDARYDTPARVAQFAAAQGAVAPNWHYASADSATLSALLGELGFSYAEATGGFDHITQTTLVDAEGRIRRQIYGEEFPFAVLVEPLRDLVSGRLRAATSLPDLIERIRYICTTFDPGAGRYRIDYGLVFGSGIAAFSLVVCFALFAREWKRSRRAAPPTA